MIYFAALPAAVSNFNLVFGGVASLAAVVLGFLSAKQKVTLVAAEDSATTLRGLNGDQKLMIESQKEQISLLQQKSTILEKHVTQAPSINELAVQLATQHKEMMTAMAAMTESNNRTAKEMGNVAKAVLKDNRAD